MAGHDSPPPPTGRFAPSPTGPLHLGSLVAAVGSYLQARSQGGRWLVRIEDIDPPREIPGAAGDILRTLESHGLTWDSGVLYQSTRFEAYRNAMQRLLDSGAAFACRCSRRKVEQLGKAGRYGWIYPGTCRERPPPVGDLAGYSIRVRADAGEVGFDDLVCGRFEQRLRDEVGDFVIRRSDGLYAYQLAVVVDDAHQGVTEIVRGADLLDNTPRQIHLQRLLGLPTPCYAHLPVVINEQGQKLSKQNLAPPLDARKASENLAAALAFLGHPIPNDLHNAPCREILDWAISVWSLQRLAVKHPQDLEPPIQPLACPTEAKGR